MRGLNHILRFRRSETGASAVEFALVFPVMMACFGAVVEASRIYWNYQSAVTGVREATRYLGRVVGEEVCAGANPAFIPMTDDSFRVTVGGVPEAYKNTVHRLVTAQVSNSADGVATLPAGVSVPLDPITVEYACPTGAGAGGGGLTVRGGFAPVIKVEARVDIQLPFATLFTFFGVESDTIETTVVDQTRVFGL